MTRVDVREGEDHLNYIEPGYEAKVVEAVQLDKQVDQTAVLKQPHVYVHQDECNDVHWWVDWVHQIEAGLFLDKVDQVDVHKCTNQIDQVDVLNRLNNTMLLPVQSEMIYFKNT